MRQPRSTEPRCPLRAGCPNPILLSPCEALEGRAPLPVRGWRLLGLREGGCEMLCLYPPGTGAECCNVTCSFGPRRGTEPTDGDVQLQCFLSKGKKNKNLL